MYLRSHKVEIDFFVETEIEQVWLLISLAAEKRQAENFKRANNAQGPPKPTINDRRSNHCTNRGVDGGSTMKAFDFTTSAAGMPRWHFACSIIHVIIVALSASD